MTTIRVATEADAEEMKKILAGFGAGLTWGASILEW